jgi:hypothetical protein
MDRASTNFSRVAWFVALAVCPVALLVLGLAVGQTGISYSERPRPVRLINASLYVHALLSAVTAATAFRVWGPRWWLAWVGILIAGGVFGAVVVGTLFSTVAYHL